MAGQAGRHHDCRAAWRKWANRNRGGNGCGTRAGLKSAQDGESPGTSKSLIKPSVVKGFPKGAHGLFAGRFGAWETALEEFDLAVVVGLVLGDMEPLSVVIGAGVGVHHSEPLVVALFELGEGAFPRFLQEIEVVIERVALDGLAGGFAELHGNSPFFRDGVGHLFKAEAAENVGVIE